MSNEILLRAADNAPEFIAQGVFDVTLEGGYYRTKNRAFADSIISNGYATEVEKEGEAKRKINRTELSPAKETTINV